VDNLAEVLNLPDLDHYLGRVEHALRSALGSEDPFLAEVASHLVLAGGKRLRPVLVLCSALAGGADVTEDVVRGSVSVELVHIGSLYHDDVMDEADSRRGVISVNARWGNLVAILAGDFLLARASEIASSLGTEVAGLLAATIGRLCEGQVGELQHGFDAGRTEQAYLSAIAGKTAALTATSCRIGALTAGLPRSQVDALTGFGEAFGMAFQIRDDVLDVIGTEASLGKPAGHDMVEGVYTLPVIRTLGTTEVGDELRALLGSPLDEATREKARQLVRESGTLPAALTVARRYADQAAEALISLPPTPASAALAKVGHHLLDTVEL
jgi:heptaprenyl diphosphate synthase